MTTRLNLLLGGALVAALAAGCSDDPGSTPNVCGDGVVAGGEQCDDGNTINGDGCSSTCQNETPGAECGNGVVETGEECDDGNTTDGDGCSSTCQEEEPEPEDCGNGVLDAGEECDDNNTTASDGCSATCTVEDGYVCAGAPSVCTMRNGSCAAPFLLTLAPEDGALVADVTGTTAGATNGTPEGPCDGFASGAGPDHTYQLTLAEDSDVFVGLFGPGTPFDALVRVLRTPCDLSTEVSEWGIQDGCSDRSLGGGHEILEYVRLTAGTYYIAVDGYNAAASGNYRLIVEAVPTACGNGVVDILEFCDDDNVLPGDGCDARCEIEPGFTCNLDVEPTVCVAEGCGNGFIEAGEECDDGNEDSDDGCSASCAVEPGYDCTGQPSVCTPTDCGNGVVEMGEECDDGNNDDGDRCSSVCVLESTLLETEPNDDEATAETITGATEIARGAFAEFFDLDFYEFTLTEDSTVEIETYETVDAQKAYAGMGSLTNVDCYAGGLDTLLFVYDDNGNTVAIDDDSGDRFCSYLSLDLPPGTYYIEASLLFYEDETADRYLLDFKATPSAAPFSPLRTIPRGDVVLKSTRARR